MSRKDYKLLAAAVSEMPEAVRAPVARALGDVLAGDNYRFDRAKWEAACAVPDGMGGQGWPFAVFNPE